MIPTLRPTDALRHAAKRCIWFETARDPLDDPAMLAAYILTFGSVSDTDALLEQLDGGELAALLDHAPPGVFDPRSWAYWNLVAGRYETPPLPVRRL